MDKFIKITLLIISGSMAILFAGNFLIHLLFYLIDGNVGKFLSPIWMVLNGRGEGEIRL